MAVNALSAFAGRWFVVKVGGELLLDLARFAASVGSAIREFCAAGIKVAVIHGAGPQATELSQRLGIQPVTFGGRRTTDQATLEVMKMALAGQVSVDVASALRGAGVRALATTGISAGLVQATRRPPVVVTGGGPEPVDMGLVGDVTSVNTSLFEAISNLGLVLVIGSLCGDERGNPLNVNADTVATRVAAELKAAKLFLVSNVPGVLRDRGDPNSRISRLTPAEARAQIASQSIQGGMIPKVEESLAVLNRGVESIHIVGIDPAHAIVEEAISPGRFGTAIGRA